MYTLHWEYMAGSIVAQAMLEKANATYRQHHVDMAAGAHKQQAYLKVNPAGRVPALTLPDGQTIGETVAIVVVLGEHFPSIGLTPQPGDPNRSIFLFWLSVMATSGYLTVARQGHPERYASDESAIAQVEKHAGKDLEAFFDVMEAGIASDTAFLASGFSALDYYLAMLTEWSENKEELFASRPCLARLCDHVSSMPEYKASMQTHRLQ